MSVASQHNYKDIDYSLKKSERKTTSIYIERDGSVSVLAPRPFDMLRIESMLEKKRSWIIAISPEFIKMHTRELKEWMSRECHLIPPAEIVVLKVTIIRLINRLQSGKLLATIGTI